MTTRGLGVAAMPLVADWIDQVIARIDADRIAELEPALAGRFANALLYEAEAHLAQNPKDGAGWDLLAPIYFGLSLGLLALALK